MAAFLSGKIALPTTWRCFALGYRSLFFRHTGVKLATRLPVATPFPFHLPATSDVFNIVQAFDVNEPKAVSAAMFALLLQMGIGCSSLGSHFSTAIVIRPL